MWVTQIKPITSNEEQNIMGENVFVMDNGAYTAKVELSKSGAPR